MSLKNGLIYDSSWGRTSGTVHLLPSEPTVAIFVPKPKKITQLIGRGLVALSLAVLFLTYLPIMALEVKQGVQRLWLNFKPKPSAFGILLTQDLATSTPIPTPLPPQEKRFQLIIPKIGANSCVLANINPSDQEKYTQALQKCVAHAQGSGLPGEENAHNRTIYLFAHSTDAPYHITHYHAVFYSLKDLESDDEIVLWFWGRKFTYLVSEKKILESNDTTYFQPQTEEERLVLQTCYPPGTTWKQLVVIAKPYPL